MRKLPAIAAGAGIAAALAGTAVAAGSRTHVMNVPLPDGSMARVEYVGDVAPKVRVVPSRVAIADPWAAGQVPLFADFGRMMQQMERQRAEMMRRVQQIAHQPGAATGVQPYVASYGNLPSGATSTSVVTYSNGQSTCTRTTEVVSQGPGKPPKVQSSVSGDCAGAPAGGASAAPTTRT